VVRLLESSGKLSMQRIKEPGDLRPSRRLRKLRHRFGKLTVEPCHTRHIPRSNVERARLGYLVDLLELELAERSVSPPARITDLRNAEVIALRSASLW
jgi:hypothetical protein